MDAARPSKGHPVKRLADEAYAGIVELITARQMHVGDRLPSEVRLAEMFGMSRTIVREALVRLSSDGITEARRGAGSYVKNRPSDRLIAYTKKSNLSAALGTYEVRFVLEAEAARLAASRRSSQDMVSIEEGLEELRAALMSSEPAHDEDMELHRRIVQATANPAFLAAFEALSDEVDKIMRAGVDISRSRPPEVLGAMLREHEAIVDAIRAQDSDGAALAMRWHLSEGRKRLMP
jgi:DNA-binding FadR family transcriptional regulator